jgi:hypothetical protein
MGMIDGSLDISISFINKGIILGEGGAESLAQITLELVRKGVVAIQNNLVTSPSIS